MSINVENLTYIYDKGSPYETYALDEISLKIESGDFVGLIGHTGSGKSTLIQHLNGLLKPSKGNIYINDIEITKKKMKLNDIRKKVGLVFQYPEYQLFEETVAKDIAFGPTNLGLKKEEIDERVRSSMRLVGLDYEEIAEKSPFELSGGQKRRVAIAGVLAMKPEVLILDEPTAGLDPKGRDEILDQIKELHRIEGITVILVSHSMEDVARLVSKLYVMNRGKLVLEGRPNEVFKNADYLSEIGLDVPQVSRLITELRKRGVDINEDIYTLESAKEEILKVLRSKKNA
ncbi:energy-coupling factor transporter ATPase [Helicovermis profundi]|uniref:Energy-coupling factor transporter ATP-binding protein EcfA2 n=1 Tax=Helicovermis profundi TaxID=3065157 RepID=A0AAU9ERT4_9FIRM|nr:energy-coupling factor transporter ATPase [Clostridia bacterium S502]